MARGLEAATTENKKPGSSLPGFFLCLFGLQCLMDQRQKLQNQ